MKTQQCTLYYIFDTSPRNFTIIRYSTSFYLPLLYFTVLYSTVIYSTLSLLYYTVLYSTPLHSTPLHSTPLYSTLLYSTLLYSTLFYSTLLYSILLFSVDSIRLDFTQPDSNLDLLCSALIYTRMHCTLRRCNKNPHNSIINLLPYHLRSYYHITYHPIAGMAQ